MYIMLMFSLNISIFSLTLRGVCNYTSFYMGFTTSSSKVIYMDYPFTVYIIIYHRNITAASFEETYMGFPSFLSPLVHTHSHCGVDLVECTEAVPLLLHTRY